MVYNQANTATTVWNPSMDTVQFKRVQVKIKNLVVGVQSMLDVLNQKMYDLSGGKPIEHTVPAEHVDDLSSTQRGKSWLEAAHTTPRDHALMRAMVLQNQWNLSWVDDDGTLRWNMTACRDFMRKAAEIVDLIITLVHIGSGPPLRGEEIIRDQITNGIQLRTLYLSFGQMVAIRRHSKDTNARGMDPFNVCYFPKCLTEAICYYLLVVRPLERLVACQLYKDKEIVQEYDLFLYVKNGRRMTSTQFSTTLERLTSEYIGIGLSLQPLRHILIAFQRAYVEELRVHRGDNIGDLISSHTSQTADAHYAVEHGQPEGYTTSYLLNVQEWCDSYHDAIGLGDRTIPLVPLRFSRRQARRLGTVFSTAGSKDPSTAIEALLPLIKELTATAYKSAMEDLKPFLSGELRTASAEATEYLLAARSFQEPEQLQGTVSGTPGSPRIRAVKRLPRGVASQPSLPSVTTEADIMRRVKRMLSSGEQPQAKRTSSGHSTTRTPVQPTTHPEEDPDITANLLRVDVQIASTPAQTAGCPDPDQHMASPDPETEPSTPSNLPFVLPISPADESATIARLSSMSLTALRDDAQTGSRAESRSSSQPGDRASSRPESSGVSSHPEERAGVRAEGYVIPPPSERWTSQCANPTPSMDPLIALRRLRRDQLADFKSPEQRDLIMSVLEGNHTLGILPTGGGKSLTYELPPVCKGQLTIAAFPFRVLTSQAAQNCRDRGITFEQWTSKDQREIEGKRLVLMAIETLLVNQVLE